MLKRISAEEASSSRCAAPLHYTFPDNFVQYRISLAAVLSFGCFVTWWWWIEWWCLYSRSYCSLV